MAPDLFEGVSDDELFDGFGDPQENPPEPEEEVVTEEESEEPEEVAEEEAEVEETEEPAVEEKTEDQLFTLKHLGETKDYSKEETITLAQKGLDYDRIRQERDTLKAEKEETADRLKFLEDLAERSGQSVDDLMVSVMAKIVYDEETKKGYTITEEQARYRVESEMKAKKRESKKQEEVKEEVDPLEQKRQDSFTRFQEEYPDVKPDDIPKEVWREFGDGSKRDLSVIYAKYLNKQLAEKAEAAEKEKENRKRSTGSRRSNGSPPVDHDFDGWGDYRA